MNLYQLISAWWCNKRLWERISKNIWESVFNFNSFWFQSLYQRPKTIKFTTQYRFTFLGPETKSPRSDKTPFLHLFPIASPFFRTSTCNSKFFKALGLSFRKIWLDQSKSQVQKLKVCFIYFLRKKFYTFNPVSLNNRFIEGVFK